MKVITEERLKEIWENFWVKNILVVDLEESIMSECKEIGAIQEENGQIIVDELRPMSDAPRDGSSVQLCTKSNTFIYGHNFGIANCKWVVPGIGSYNDDDFLGWIPGAIYRPKDGA